MIKGFNRFYIFILSCFFAFNPINLVGQEKISWAGLSYMSQANEVESLYPFSVSLEKIIQPLLREVSLAQEKDYELVTSELVDSDLGDNRTIVVALDKERITGGQLESIQRRFF